MLAQVPALAPLVRQRLGGQTHLLVHEAAEEQDEDALQWGLNGEGDSSQQEMWVPGAGSAAAHWTG